MKKILFLIAASFAAAACNNAKICQINGTIDSTYNGKVVFLHDISAGKNIDSVTIADGKFMFKPNADSVKFLQVYVERMGARVLAEKGEVNVTLGNPSTVSGTPLNDAYEAFRKEEKAIYDATMEKVGAMDRKTEMEAIEAAYGEADKQMNELRNKYFEENKTNLVGVALVGSLLQDKSVAQIDSMINVVGDLAKNYSPITKLRERKVNEENTAEGNKFTDFDGLNPDGTVGKLSDYVGKGNYVLVDFWASWCGPCKAEIPVIKEVYEKYKGKGLVVLGANVWDKKDSFEKAVKDMEMPWAQLCNFDNNTATDLYGIAGIPHIILFAPDGTIVARNLRGDAMKAKLAEVYK